MDADGLLVLSIDDDPCISRVVQLKLQNAGYRVLRAVTAEEGLLKIRELHPDIIITDVKMPGMSGIDLCRECEEMTPDADYLTIVLTAQLDDESRKWVESSPRRRFISKPFSPRKILATIEEYRRTREQVATA
ncbi:MAG: response regulator [Planctomycetes bacterium]|jgi:DNA-binding response OmpR family regulator|nr:response regulator [Planctomycetota bacterium]